ncbi:MAG: hypothetical protein AAF958_16855 [Planctomycetota bacterium]
MPTDSNDVSENPYSTGETEPQVGSPTESAAVAADTTPASETKPVGKTQSAAAAQAPAGIGGVVWLAIGVIGATLVIGNLIAVLPAMKPDFPQEYYDLDLNSPDGIAEQEVFEVALKSQMRTRFLLFNGILISGLFGLVALLRSPKKAVGAVGLVIGVGVAVVLGLSLSDPIAQQESLAQQARDQGGLRSIIVHSVVWLAILGSAAIAIALASVRGIEAVKAIAAAVLAAILAGAGYVILAGLLAPLAPVYEATPGEGMLTILWGCLGPILFGFLLFRMLAPPAAGGTKVAASP